MGQVTGDFQTKTTTGNWSDFNSWNIYNSSAWIPAVAGQIPLATSNVFVQFSNTINVDITTAVCNDLSFTATLTTLKVVVLANNTLTIYGNLNQFDNTNVPFPSFGANAKLIFAGGGNQIITNSGANTNLNTVEINKSGGSFTLPGATTKFNVFTLSAGTITGAAGSTLQGNSTAAIVNVNGGIWNQNLGGANKIPPLVIVTFEKLYPSPTPLVVDNVIAPLFIFNIQLAPPVPPFILFAPPKF